MKKGLYRLEVYYKQNATESEKEVLRYLIHHTREAVEMDIHTIAKKCFCSPAAIIRLCKKNGFLGFKELKQALLLSGRYIYLYGIGANFLVAKDFQQKFERVGASSSRVSQLSVVDIVYNTYLSMEKDKSMEKILSTNKLLEKKKRIDKSFYPYSAF